MNHVDIKLFEFAAEDFIWYEEEEIKRIERLLKKYPYHVYNWYSERIDLYTISGDEILFILQGDLPNGTYSAKTKVAYEKIDQLIGDLGERQQQDWDAKWRQRKCKQLTIDAIPEMKKMLEKQVQNNVIEAVLEEFTREQE